MRLIVYLLINGIAVFLADYLLPGVKVESFLFALVVAIVLGVVNAFLRPLLMLLTLPITVLTLGLFALVINAFLIVIVDFLVPELVVDNFWWAILFSITVSLISTFLSRLSQK